jgi:hypothetical protein
MPLQHDMNRSHPNLTWLQMLDLAAKDRQGQTPSLVFLIISDEENQLYED